MLQSHSESFAHWDGECMLPPEQQEAFMQVIESSALPTTIYKHIQTRLTYDRAFKMQTARLCQVAFAEPATACELVDGMEDLTT